MIRDTTFIDSGFALDATGLPHRVHQPTGPGPHRTIVLIHGRSGNEEVMWIFSRALPPDWLLVAPRAPLADYRGGYSWDVRPAGDWPTVDQLEPGAHTLAAFTAALPDVYDADPAQTYFMGFSQGAATIFTLTMRTAIRPRAVAALVGFMPRAASDAEIARFADLPVHMAVGRRDPTIPLAHAHTAAHTLITGGARLDYRVYDTGHKLNARGIRDLGSWWERFQ